MLQATEWIISGATKITQPQPTFSEAPELSEKQPSQLTETPVFLHESPATDVGMWVISIDVAVILAILIFPFLQELSRFKMNSIPFVRASRIPCRNCRFLSNSSYLKCAVHPTSALTEEAIACPDYRPRNITV
jgi:hypothetical protein